MIKKVINRKDHSEPAASWVGMFSEEGVLQIRHVLPDYVEG